ncbi:MAG: twin-arginine translocase TatA/TatE family subunit [Chloroflexi bacterium]|nr:twin-arginine translocase TatA/TatE family subunit [Chloroflexota bacterium]
MPFRLEPLDLVLILIAALLLFGPKRIPETARAIGKSIREFREAIAIKDEPEPEARAKVAAQKPGQEPAVSRAAPAGKDELEPTTHQTTEKIQSG